MDHLYWVTKLDRILVVASSEEEAKSFARQRNFPAGEPIDLIWDIEDLGVVESGPIEWAYGGEY